ncbi:hypothetical protein CRM22_004797 [Opisthorchis felineus]|uniref:Uncharacterized protein n=1 Tax=Opisthorchis felineus TaxID=147828 RepID=A0A4S2M0V2_OPIFE|nr:hypothetical protein CRM22_004797 [Opisthorchis felineus]
MVVIVDKRIDSFRGINRRLAEACEGSTEFHLPDLDCQLASIQETINRPGPRLPGAVNDDTLAVACPTVDSDCLGSIIGASPSIEVECFHLRLHLIRSACLVVIHPI